MADEKTNPDEPSIEEILSSIRDIISEDDGDKKKADPPESAEPDEDLSDLVEDTPAPAEDKTPEPEGVDESEAEDDDVLDLSNFADDNAKEVDPNDPLAGIDLGHPDEDDLDIADVAPVTAPEPVAAEEESAPSDPEPDFDIMDDNDQDDDGDIFDSLPSLPESEPEPEAQDESGLVDRVAELATVGAMSKLAENIALARTREGVTLEDIVRDLLKPMLKDWLDDNLPSLIERLVEQELERLAQKATRGK